MKKTIEVVGLLSSILGLGPLVTGVYAVIKVFQDDHTDRTLYILLAIGCLSLIAGIVLFHIYFTNRLKSKSPYKMEKQLDLYIKNTGAAYLNSKNSQELIKKTRESIRKLINKGVTDTLDEEVYYIYLFSLLNGATKRVWAASIMGKEEWNETPEENEFLRLNIAASLRMVLVERIFIVEQAEIGEMLSNDAIKKQINKRNDYLKTYIIIKEEIARERPHLLTDIGSGFLAFDDFAIASDVFEDSYIRGILNLDEETLRKNNRNFTNLRDFAKPLDKKFAIAHATP